MPPSFQRERIENTNYVIYLLQKRTIYFAHCFFRLLPPSFFLFCDIWPQEPLFKIG